MGWFRRILTALKLVKDEPKVIKETTSEAQCPSLRFSDILKLRKHLKEVYPTRCPMCGTGGHSRLQKHRRVCG